MLKVSYIKIYKCKNRYREREPGEAGGAGPCAPSPGSFCCLSFFCVCVFFLQKNPKSEQDSRFPQAPGARGSSSSSSPEPSRGIPAAPLLLALLELLPGKGSRRGVGSTARCGGAAPHRPGRENAQLLCGNGPGQVGSRGPPLCAPRERGGSRPDPKTGAGKFLVSSSPSSSAPPRPGVVPGPPPCSGPAGLAPNPGFPLGGIHTLQPTAPTWDGTRAGRPGCAWGRKRRVWEEERKGPGPPTAGRARSWKTLFWVFFSKLSLFPTPLFFLAGSHLQQCHNRTPRVPRVPAALPPRSRPAELQRFSFFPIITIIINSNAGCNNKKNQLFPPEEAAIVPQGCVPAPLSTTFPWSSSTPTGQGALPRNNQDPRKNIKTTPAEAGEGSGSPRVKTPVGSPPEHAKGITEPPQSKAKDSPGRGGIQGI